MPALRALLPADRIVAVQGSLDVPVREVVTDSRLVQPGDVFVCLPGYRSEGGETRADRHDFIPAALAAGAAALVVDREVSAPPHVTVVRVADAWGAVAGMAAAFHGEPSHQLTVVGVTGTSGKTSTPYFIDAVLAAGGARVARLGTIDYRLGARFTALAAVAGQADEHVARLHQARVGDHRAHRHVERALHRDDAVGGQQGVQRGHRAGSGARGGPCGAQPLGHGRNRLEQHVDARAFRADHLGELRLVLRQQGIELGFLALDDGVALAEAGVDLLGDLLERFLAVFAEFAADLLGP